MGLSQELCRMMLTMLLHSSQILSRSGLAVCSRAGCPLCSHRWAGHSLLGRLDTCHAAQYSSLYFHIRWERPQQAL